MNKAIVRLRQDTDKAISANMPAEEIMATIYPRALSALDEADGAEQVNEIRHQIETVVLYVNKKIPAETGDRWKQLKKANKGNDLFLLACRKAGTIWDMMEKYKGRPPETDDGKSGQKLPLFTAQQAGFSGRHDASRCAKVSRIHDEDFRTYKDECDVNGRQYTLGGLVNVYDMMQPKEEEGGGDEVRFSKGSAIDRMHGIRKKIEGLLTDLYDDAEKDWTNETSNLEKAFKFVQKAIESAEGQKESE